MSTLTALEKFQQSSAWDLRYGLPLCPGNNNPWIYSAYAAWIMGRADGSRLDTQAVLSYFVACQQSANKRLGTEETGIFDRWPGGFGGMNSHDEIIGAASHSAIIASEILDYLDRHDGEFNNTGEKPGDVLGESWNVYRMIFLRPYLLARVGRPASFFSQAAWCIHILFDMLTRRKDDAGGALRNGLMIACIPADKYPAMALAGSLWRWRVQRLMSPKDCLTVEPKEHPIFAELAPETW